MKCPVCKKTCVYGIDELMVEMHGKCWECTKEDKDAKSLHKRPRGDVREG